MNEIDQFLANQHQLHLNNAQQIYYAECYRQSGPRSKISIMPATPFIFEFFIYNSLYHYDWEESFAAGRLISHDEQHLDPERRKSESSKQNCLEHFIRKRCQGKPGLLKKAFLPLASLGSLNAPWTEVRDGGRISSEDGKSFFKHLSTLRDLIIADQPLQPTRAVFDEINRCRFFVSNVRNNIFHGSKVLGDLDRDQGRRVAVYHRFIQGLVSLFFLACDFGSAACDEVCLPIELKANSGKGIELGADEVLALVVKGLMKPEDCHMIPWVHQRLAIEGSRPSPAGCLFYPSAGDDVITPVLLGLPYCTEFHFYDTSRKHNGLKRLATLMKGRPPVDLDRGNPVEITFEFDGIARRVRSTTGDNLDFLKTASPLVFFFRRGDSHEGGSSQEWESREFEKWRALIPAGSTCSVLTDGIPGGIDERLLAKLGPPHKFPNSERGRDYYCGVFR